MSWWNVDTPIPKLIDSHANNVLRSDVELNLIVLLPLLLVNVHWTYAMCMFVYACVYVYECMCIYCVGECMGYRTCSSTTLPSTPDCSLFVYTQYTKSPPLSTSLYESLASTSHLSMPLSRSFLINYQNIRYPGINHAEY